MAILLDNNDQILTETGNTSLNQRNRENATNMREKLKIDSIFKDEGFSVIKQQEFKISFDKRIN